MSRALLLQKRALSPQKTALSRQQRVSARWRVLCAQLLILTLSLWMPAVLWAAGSTNGDRLPVDMEEGAVVDESSLDEGQADVAQGVPEGQRQERAFPLLRQSLLEALASELPPAQQIQLQGASETFWALYRPAVWAQPLGGVLILHDRDQHAAWPRYVEPLRQGLADQGWHTLSLNLPAESPAVIPRQASPSQEALVDGEGLPAPENEVVVQDDDLELESQPGEAEHAKAAQEAEKEQDAATLEAERVTRIQARIEAGIAYLQTLDIEHLVLLGVGEGGRLAAGYLSHQGNVRLGTRLALVWVELESGLQKHDEPEPLFGVRPYPHILDLVNSLDRLQLDAAQERARVARRLSLEGYRQLRLPLRDTERASSPQLDRLVVKRLGSWLRDWAGRENTVEDVEVESF